MNPTKVTVSFTFDDHQRGVINDLHNRKGLAGKEELRAWIAALVYSEIQSLVDDYDRETQVNET